MCLKKKKKNIVVDNEIPESFRIENPKQYALK